MARFIIRCVQYEKRGETGCCFITGSLYCLHQWLLQRLHSSGVGCHIGGVLAGDFGYDGDIVLLSPSVDALRHMICICEAYAEDYNIILNPTKSTLLYYNVTHTHLIIELSGQPVNVVIQKNISR